MTAHRPFLGVCLSFALGIILSRILSFPFYISFLFAVIFLAVSCGFKQKNVAHTSLLCSFIFLGISYTQSFRTTPSDHLSFVVKRYQPSEIELYGTVASDIQRRTWAQGEKISFVAETKGLKRYGRWARCSGKVMVNIFREMDIDYGDEILLEGKLHKPYDFSSEKNFSYRDYLRNQGIDYVFSVGKKGNVKINGKGYGSYLKTRFLNLRDQLKAVLSKGLSKSEAAIMSAFILGDRTNIPNHLKDLFAQTGTAHILAISGMNVGVVAALFLAFLKILPMPRRMQLILTIVLLMGYAFLTGSSPSVVRATIMAIVFLMSFVWDKNSDILNTLFLAALIILLINPLNLFDVGFQLSFVCVLAIILLFPVLDSAVFTVWKTDHPMIKTVVSSLTLSFAVWLGVAGLIAYYFNIVTPVTILANLVVVPLSTALVILGFGMLLTGWILPAAVSLFGVCIQCVLSLLVSAVYLSAQIPGAYFEISSINIWSIISYYIFLIICFYWPVSRGLTKVSKAYWNLPS